MKASTHVGTCSGPHAILRDEVDSRDLSAPRATHGVRESRRWAGALLGLPIVLALLVGCSERGAGSRKNLVFISIDSLRADHLGCYGYARPTTPALDRIAAEGLLFENLIAESSWTLPSHITMLTGLSSLVHGVDVDDNRLAAGVPTLASRLKRAGYHTQGIYSGPYLHPVFGFSRGFDDYEGVYGTPSLEAVDSRLGAPGSKGWRGTLRQANSLSHRTITSPAVTDTAIAFLERAQEPFFLFIHYFDVHYDYIPPEPLWRKFDPDYDGTLTCDNYSRNPAIHPGMSRRDLDHVVALYDGEILFTDQHVGRLLNALKGAGLTDRTLLMVTSDHGQEFFEHGRKGHQHSLFDEVLKVPLLIRLPGVLPAGRRVRRQVRHVDLVPTALELLGLPAEPPLTGRALLRRDGNPSPATEDLPAFSRLVAKGSVWGSIRTSSRKYIVRHRAGERREVLFDLAEDPGEKSPVVERTIQGPGDLDALDAFRDRLAREAAADMRIRRAHGAQPTGHVDLPEDVREQLRALGYTE